MAPLSELTNIIVATVREIGEQDEVEVPVELDGSTALFGEGGFLDSMSLVSLVVALEQAIDDKFGKAISLADEKALSQKQSPYRTVDSLARYAAAELAQT